MAVKFSTGLAAHVGVTGSVKEALDGGFIKVYSGTPPTSADSAVSGTLLWTVSVDGTGTGLTIAPAANGRAFEKPSATTWAGATTAGTATYWRFVAPTDTGAASTTEKRIQGNVGSAAGFDMYMSNPVLETSSEPLAKLLTGFSIAIPEY